MDIGNQNNVNNGDVYNIETIHGNLNNHHIDMSRYLIEESSIPVQAISNCKSEKVIFSIVGAVGLFADLVDIYPLFNPSWWVYIIAFLAVYFYLSHKYGHIFELHIGSSPIQKDNKLLLRNGNSFSLYRSEAPCIYPNCSGFVIPIEPPETYNGPYSLMGQCSEVGLQHGYIIDNNLQAFPNEIHELYSLRSE